VKTINNTFLFQEAVSVLKSGKNVKIRLVGQSMFPFLHPETDILTIAPKCFNGLRVGDVVLAYYHGDYILHRIISIQKNGTYLLQGDAILKRCEWVDYRNVVGVLNSIERDNSTIICCMNCRWRVKGLLWVKMRFIRKPLLKIIGITKKCAVSNKRLDKE